MEDTWESWESSMCPSGLLSGFLFLRTHRHTLTRPTLQEMMIQWIDANLFLSYPLCSLMLLPRFLHSFLPRSDLPFLSFAFVFAPVLNDFVGL